MRRAVILGGLVVAGALSMAVVAAQPTQGAIQIEKVRNNLYLVTGGHGTSAQGTGIAGNTTVLITDAGVVLIDTKYAGYGKAILDQIRSVTDKPITTLINTHTHADHTGSNSELPRTVEFIAHENTRANMTRMEEFKGPKAAFLPSKTFKDTMTLSSGAERIELRYFGAGHTNGDAVIVLPSLRIAVMGDLFARKWAPLIDSENGGSATAFPGTLAKAVSSIKDVDTVITGHATTTLGSGASQWFVRSNPVMKWSDLQEYADFMREFVAAAQAAKKAGKTAGEAATSLGLSARFKDYNMARAAEDIQKVYDESAR